MQKQTRINLSSLPLQHSTKKLNMTKILIAIFLGGGTGSVLRYFVQVALHEPDNFLLLPVGYIHRQHSRQFPHRTVLCPLRPLQPIYRNTVVTDRRPVWRVHHILHLQQRRDDSHQARVLRDVFPIHLIKRCFRPHRHHYRWSLRTLPVTGSEPNDRTFYAFLLL